MEKRRRKAAERDSPSLMLVGTVHLDPTGFERLLALLKAARPKTVTVEVSPYALKFRRSTGREMLKRLDAFRRPDGSLPPALAAVAAQLAVPFEYRAAASHARRTGARLCRIGDSRESERLLGLLERELMATDNLVTLALRDEPEIAELVDREWARARRIFRDRRLSGSDVAGRLSRRNQRLAEKIRPLIADGTVVHIGGWEHLEGLAELLSELEPQVRLLRGGRDQNRRVNR